MGVRSGWWSEWIRRVGVTDFRLLGPLELRVAGRTVEPGPPQRRAVLASLLAEAGRPVPVDTLIDRLWGEHPPAEARASL